MGSQVRQIFLRGLPGSGKSTFGRLLAAKVPGSQYISSGQLLRKAAATDQDLTRVLARGELVDSSVIMSIMSSEISKHSSMSSVFILDGFPRKLEEMKEWIQRTSAPILVVYIELSTEAIVQRLINRTVCSSCGANYNSFHDSSTPAISPENIDTCDACQTKTLLHRPEDSEAVIRRRLETSLLNEHEITDYLKGVVSQRKILYINSLNREQGVQIVSELLQR